MMPQIMYVTTESSLPLTCPAVANEDWHERLQKIGSGSESDASYRSQEEETHKPTYRNVEISMQADRISCKKNLNAKLNQTNGIKLN